MAIRRSATGYETVERVSRAPGGWHIGNFVRPSQVAEVSTGDVQVLRPIPYLSIVRGKNTAGETRNRLLNFSIWVLLRSRFLCKTSDTMLSVPKTGWTDVVSCAREC